MIEFVLFHLQCNERVTDFQRVEIFVFVFAQPVEKMTAKTKINNEKKRDVGVCSALFEIVILNIGNCLKSHNRCVLNYNFIVLYHHRV